MSLLTALAPLGAKYKLQLVPEFEGDSVSVSVIYSLKSDKEPVIKTLVFSGTPAEVDVALAEQLPKAVEKLAAHATTLEELDKQLAGEVEKKKEELKPKTTAPARPLVKHTPPKGKAQPTTPKQSVKAGSPKLEPETPPAPPPEPLPPGALKPAWMQQPAATVVETVGTTPTTAEGEGDLGSLFAEEGEK